MGVFRAAALTFVLVLTAVPMLPGEETAGAPYDILFVGGEVIDGTGAPRYRADVAVTGDRIAAIGDLRGAQAGQIIDVKGLVVTPGFIDPYTNFIGGEAFGPLHENAIQQGITTTAISVEGGYSDKQEERRLVEQQGTAINLVQFFPFSVAYSEVVDTPEVTPEQLEELKGLARQAMEDGAFAMGTALAYCPSCFAPTEVIIEVAKEVAPYHGHYSSHIRNEDRHVFNATAELIAIAEGAGIPGVVHHMKVMGAARCGLAEETTGLVRDAQARGLDVAANAYPYNAGFTTDLGLFIPDEYEEGTEAERQLRWRNPATRAEVVAAIAASIEEMAGTADRIYFSVQRTTLAEEAALRMVSPAEALLQMVENHEVRLYVLHFGCDEDLRTIFTQPWTSVLTDGQPWGGSEATHAGHPRVYGTYARVLGQLARDEGWFSLEEAVRKMTGQPAYRLGLAHADRGLLRDGWFADLVVFDPVTVADRATYEQPGQAPSGFDWVLVNGVPVLRNGELAPVEERLANPPGRFLFHTAEMPSEPQPGYDPRVPRPTTPETEREDDERPGFAPVEGWVLFVAVVAALALARRNR